MRNERKKNERKKRKRQMQRLGLQPAPGNSVFDYTNVDEGLPTDAISHNGSTDTADDPASGGKSATSANALSAITQPAAAAAAATPAATVLPTPPEAVVGEPVVKEEPAGTSNCSAAVLANPTLPSDLSQPPEVPDLVRPDASAVTNPPQLSPLALVDRPSNPCSAAVLAHPILPSSVVSLPPELCAEAAHGVSNLGRPGASDATNPPQLSPLAVAPADRLSSLKRQDIGLAPTDQADHGSSGATMSHDTHQQASVSAIRQVQP